MSELMLYSTSACQLCERAQRLIHDVLGVPVAELDISSDERLLARYAMRIPVLRRLDTGVEIDWPFGPEAIRRLVNQPDLIAD